MVLIRSVRGFVEGNGMMLRCLALILLCAGVLRAAEPPATKEGVEFFKQQALPVLQSNCFKCHGGEKIKGGLILTSRQGLIKGGDLGTVLSPDKPLESLLLTMISYSDDEHQMPPTGKLKPEQILALTRWVQMGAPWPEGVDLTNPKLLAEHKASAVAPATELWAVKPLQRPSVPVVKEPAWVRNPIDAFVLATGRQGGAGPAGLL
jgi:mono/diheme cytochrome c family protein